MSKTWFRLSIVLLFSCLFHGLWGEQFNVLEEIGKAEQFYADERYIDAIYCYTKVVEEDPRNVIGYQGMGDCYFKIKRYSEALENYKKVEWIEPNTINYRLGLTYYCIGDYKNSKNYFIQTLNNDPGRVNANYYLGRIHEYHKEIDYALDCYKNELQNAPVEMNFLFLARFYYKQGKYDEAVEVIDRLMEKSPYSADGYLIYAQIAEKKDFENKAIEDYQQAARLGSAEAQLWLEKRGVPWREKKGFFDFLLFWKD